MREVVEVLVVERREVDRSEKRRGEESRPKKHQLLPYIIIETATAVAKDMRAKEKKMTS